MFKKVVIWSIFIVIAIITCWFVDKIMLERGTAFLAIGVFDLVIIGMCGVAADTIAWIVNYM